MRLRAEPGASLRADFTEQEGFELSGDIVTPWRVTIIARDLDALVNTDIITSLNPGSRPGTVRRHVVDRPRTLAVELVERASTEAS